MNVNLYSAIKKSLLSKFSIYIVQFLSMIIYARMFTPEQFGILASIQVFVIFFQMIAEIGIGPAIINEERFSSKQRNGIFTVTLILAIIFGIAFYFFSFFISLFYGEYDYHDISIIISFSVFFNTLNIVPTTALNKDAKFITIAKINILSELLSFMAVYFLYYFEYGILALVFKSLAQSVLNLVFFWSLSKKTTLGRPLFGKQIYHIKKIAGFATYQFLFNFINYFSRNLDNILIGKYLGMELLGVYNKSYQLMRYPLMITTFAMTPAIQPVLTKIRNDVNKIVEEHNKLTMRLFGVSILISSFLYINSENIVLFLFGAQWRSVIPLIEIFSLMIPVQAVLSTSGSFYQVMNKPKLLFISGFISAIINIIAIIVSVYSKSLEYIAISLLISFSINFIQCYFIMFKYCFVRSSKEFSSGLLRVSIIAGFPVCIYLFFKLSLINYLPQELVLNLVSNIFLAIVSLSFFYKPIKDIYFK